MTKILISIHRAEHRVNLITEHFFSRHPFLGYLTVFAGLPLVILGAVFACTTVLALPFMLIFG